MFKSDRVKVSVTICAFLGFLGITAFVLKVNDRLFEIDALLEQACHKEVRKGAPFGHRSVITYDYDEESRNLGIASGVFQAQYSRGKWTQVAWTCRINPSTYEIARVELTAAGGGQKLKAAAAAFQ